MIPAGAVPSLIASARPPGALPEVALEYTGDGVRTVQHRRWADGRVHQRLSQTIMPNINCTAGVSDAVGPAGVSWTVPRDDTSFRMFSVVVPRAGADPAQDAATLGMLQPGWGPGKPYDEWTLADHQRWQTDYVTQKGQGDINLHSEEHLTGIDRATLMNRRLFKQQAAVVAAGGDPVGVTFDEPYLLQIMAGNAMLSGDTTVCLDGYDGRRMFEQQQVVAAD